MSIHARIVLMFHELLKIWFQWVHDWGYTGVFFLMAMESSIIPVPSEVVMPPAAFWAAQGKMDFWGVVIAGTLGSYFGSAISYWVSQWVGYPLLKKYGKYVFLPPAKLELAQTWVARYGMGGIFVARLLPVVRHLISIPAGILKMPFARFSWVTTLGAGIWCWILAWFGQKVIGARPELIQSPEAMVAVMKEQMHWFLAAVVVLAVLYVLVLWFKSKNVSKSIAMGVLGVACFGFSSGCSSSSKNMISFTSNVVVVSIDGLRPEFYLESKYPMPTLQKLVKFGTSAPGLIPSYPSSTFPTHASIATGVRPAKHGIHANTLFDLHKGPLMDWNWDAKRLKAPAIWDVAKANGKTVALFGWPVSLHANADWVIPEIFSPSGIDHDANWIEMQKHIPASFLKEISEHNKISKIKSNPDYDQWLLDGLIYIYKKNQPDLSMIHFRSLDEIQHLKGRNSSELKKILAQIDLWISKLMDQIDFSKTSLLIIGDHGFVDYKNIIRINNLFAQQGWLVSESNWKVIAHPHDGYAAIYLKDSSLSEQLNSVLEANQKIGYKIISRKELDTLGALPNAFCSLDALPGYSFSKKIEGELVEKLNSVRGQHGGIADSEKNLWSGFVAFGNGIPSQQLDKALDITDVAPTIAALLHVPMNHTDGKPVSFAPLPASAD